VFERVLYIWAIRHPASGYVQGINDLVTPFFVVFLSEYLADGQSKCLLIFFFVTLEFRLVEPKPKSVVVVAAAVVAVAAAVEIVVIVAVVFIFVVLLFFLVVTCHSI